MRCRAEDVEHGGPDEGEIVECDDGLWAVEGAAGVFAEIEVWVREALLVRVDGDEAVGVAVEEVRPEEGHDFVVLGCCQGDFGLWLGGWDGGGLGCRGRRRLHGLWIRIKFRGKVS